LIGYTYTFPREDRRSFLRDGREFSTMLNSCGRISKSGVGIAICMGDRNKILREGETILSEYRKLIREYMNVLTNERWRISESETCVIHEGARKVTGLIECDFPCLWVCIRPMWRVNLEQN